MKKLHRFVYLALVLVLLLTACTQQPGAIPGTGEQTGTPPVSPELPPAAVLAAQSWLSAETGVAVEDIEITEMEQVDWQDSCLGLGGPAESCLQAITPGWRVIFTIDGQEYEVRTDETGSVIRMAETASTPGAGDSLAGTEWRLVSFGEAGAETPVIEGSEITLAFEQDGQAGGNGGCNSYGGPYQAQDGTLSFGQMVSTLMACADENVTQQESRYLQALQTASAYSLAGDQLTIEYGQGVLNFVAAE